MSVASVANSPLVHFGVGHNGGSFTNNGIFEVRDAGNFNGSTDAIWGFPVVNQRMTITNNAIMRLVDGPGAASGNGMLNRWMEANASGDLTFTNAATGTITMDNRMSAFLFTPAGDLQFTNHGAITFSDRDGPGTTYLGEIPLLDTSSTSPNRTRFHNTGTIITGGLGPMPGANSYLYNDGTIESYSASPGVTFV
jgi:hypothetical protein